MRAAPNNPPENVLGACVPHQGLVEAIERSGYPLQSTVAAVLQSEFDLAEEWSYIDRDSGEPRALDILAWRPYPDTPNAALTLELLVECKRSAQPYVFFRRVIDSELREFPAVLGLPRHIYLGRIAGNRQMAISPAELLKLEKLPFATQVPICATFARADLLGKKVSLSGADPYNSLVRPLGKALDFLRSTYDPRKNWTKRPLVLAICISVVDAPMVLVEHPSSASDPVLTPWIRVVRQEAAPDQHEGTHRNYTIDVVHAGFLRTWIEAQLIPFADAFVERAAKKVDALFNGGFVADLDQWDWMDVRPGVRK